MFSDMHVSVTCKCFSMCYHYAIPTPLDYCLQIMMLAVNIQMFTASLQRLQMSPNKSHEWSNSVGKKFFQRLLEAIAPHYNLWVYVVHYYPYMLPYILHYYPNILPFTFSLYILPYILHYYPNILPYLLHFNFTIHSGYMLYTIPLHFTIHLLPNLTPMSILPLTLLKCPQFNFTIHSRCMLYTIPLHFTIHLLPNLTPMSTVHFQQVGTSTSQDPHICTFRKWVR